MTNIRKGKGDEEYHRTESTFLESEESKPSEGDRMSRVPQDPVILVLQKVNKPEEVVV